MSEADTQSTSAGDGTDPRAIDAFIGRWKKSGGSELANFQMFADELCDLLGVKRPDPSQAENESNDYVFERRVDFKFDDGSTSAGRIDLYKRDCFVMEAKQSAKRVRARKADPRQPDLLPEDATQVKPGAATRGTYGWDRVMRAAKRQAEDYARALPKAHGWPPFILVVDVGHVIEVYADFSGQGKNYAQFPDRAGYFHSAGRPARFENPCPAARDLDRPPRPQPGQAQRGSDPRHRRTARPHRTQSGRQVRSGSSRRIPHALSVHHVRRGCRPAAGEGASRNCWRGW